MGEDRMKVNLMRPPTEWTKKWAYDHPWQALGMLLFGGVMMGFVVWICIADVRFLG
jgi:hypothetical protein